MPNYFFIFACYTLPDIDVINELDEILPQLEVLFRGANLESVLTYMKWFDDVKSNCCCSHSIGIGHSFILENNETKLRFLTGNCCVKKDGFIGANKINKAIEKRNVLQNKFKIQKKILVINL